MAFGTHHESEREWLTVVGAVGDVRPIGRDRAVRLQRWLSAMSSSRLQQQQERIAQGLSLADMQERTGMIRSLKEVYEVG